MYEQGEEEAREAYRKVDREARAEYETTISACRRKYYRRIRALEAEIDKLWEEFNEEPVVSAAQTRMGAALSAAYIKYLSPFLRQ